MINRSRRITTHLEPHQRVDLHALVVEQREDAIGRHRPAAGGRGAAPARRPALHVAGEHLAVRLRQRSQPLLLLVAIIQEPGRRNACPLPREEHVAVPAASAAIAGELAARLGVAERGVPDGRRRRRGRAPTEAELVQEHGSDAGAADRGTLQRPEGVADVVGQKGGVEEVLRLDGHRHRRLVLGSKRPGRGGGEMWVVERQRAGGKLYIRGTGRGGHVGWVLWGCLQGDKSCRFFVYLDEERGEAGQRRQRQQQATNGLDGCCWDLSFSPPLIMAIVYLFLSRLAFVCATLLFLFLSHMGFFVAWRLIRPVA